MYINEIQHVRNRAFTGWVGGLLLFVYVLYKLNVTVYYYTCINVLFKRSDRFSLLLLFIAYEYSVL